MTNKNILLKFLFYKHTKSLLLLLLALLFSNYVFAQHNVDFSVSKTNGCAPYLLQFKNLTENLTDYTYLWDLGNGNTSTQTEPTATYVNPGFYTIVLTAKKGSDEIVITKDNYIFVASPPAVDFTPNENTSGCVPLNIQFTSNISSSYAINNYTWDFGDGNLSDESSPLHQYNSDGIYNVTLIVEDENGCTSKTTYENLVKAQKPTPMFEVDENFSCTGELLSSFNNQSYGIGTFSYLWNFSDGGTSTDKDPNYTFTSAGIFDVKLKVTDDLGCTDSIIREDFIRIENTKALFTTEKDIYCPNESVILTNISENNRKNNWLFGDGQSSINANTSHSYSVPGEYTIKLSVENYTCTDSFEKNITIEDVEVDFSVSQDYSCEVPVNISYTPVANNISSYDWKFGNGKVSSDKNPTVSFEINDFLKQNNLQTYSDTLTVTSFNGCKKTIIKPDNVTIKLPAIKINTDKNASGCTPIDLSFTSESSYDSDVDFFTDYTWEIDGNVTSNQESFDFQFANIGKFSVAIKAQTQKGCMASDILEVKVGRKQNPDFSVKDNKAEFCASETVEFVDLSSDQNEIDNIVWVFGDGEESFMGIPFHNYLDTGFMSVGLKVFHNGCLSSITKPNLIRIKGPLMNVKRVDFCDSPYDAKFEVNLKGGDTVQVNFGDGITKKYVQKNISHNYKSEGIFATTFTSTNKESGCSYIAKNNILISDPKALYDTISSVPCKSTTISFDPSQSIGAIEYTLNNQRNTYLWDFDDGSSAFTANEATHKYNIAGVYNPKLIIKDINGCTDTFYTSIEIFSPLPNFSVNYLEGCLPAKFIFNDESVSKNPITQWSWNFGDSQGSTSQNPTHEYENFGEYKVYLTIKDTKGCSSIYTQNKEIKATKPDASFSVNKSKSCINEAIDFFDTSVSNIESFLWNFGDGTTSTQRNPSHSYKTKGDFDVSLHIIDDHGCELTKQVNSFVNIQKPPVADFTTDDTISNCFPYLVNFENKSTSDYLGSFKWEFGDNLTSSTLKNPKHIYTKPDIYNIQLVAFTTNGCSDTIIKNDLITVKGPYADIVLSDTACVYNNITFSLLNEKNITNNVWDFGDGISSNKYTPVHKYENKGTHYISIVLNTNSQYGCTKVISDSIYIDEITSDFSFSENIESGCVPFNPTIINNSIRTDFYSWTTSSNKSSTEQTPDFIFENSGVDIIELIAGNEFGCKDTSKKAITIFPLPVTQTSNDTLICRGDNALLFATGGNQYSWNNSIFLDDAQIDNPIANPDTSTIFKVLVTDINNCSKSDSVYITVQQPASVDIKDTTIIIGENIKLDVSKPDIISYNWSPNENISCTNCPNPLIYTKENLEYTLNIVDTSNCFTISYPYNVLVEKKYSVDVPSAFTPNGDGINDTITVKGWGIKELKYFRVFNKFGQMIFESNNIDIGWDGFYNGNPQASDIYNYVVKVQSLNDNYLEKKGKIKLIR